VELSAAVHPVFFDEYSDYLAELTRAVREVGFTIRPTNTTMAEYLEAQDGRPDVVIGRWIADYPDPDTFIYGIVRSREGLIGRVCGDPEVDRLAERARAEIDPRARHSLYRRIEERIAREALLLPLFHEQVYRFARPEIEGMQLGLGQSSVAYANLSIRR
jgi:ABC-type oligopeptide transport system substrate-binding subunit